MNRNEFNDKYKRVEEEYHKYKKISQLYSDVDGYNYLINMLFQLNHMGKIQIFTSNNSSIGVPTLSKNAQVKIKNIIIEDLELQVKNVEKEIEEKYNEFSNKI